MLPQLETPSCTERGGTHGQCQGQAVAKTAEIPAGALQEFGQPINNKPTPGGKFNNCLTCSRNCPMSLDVNQMVQRADMEDGECILCGNCVDGCPKEAICFSFSAG
jgi:ferredoxin